MHKMCYCDDNVFLTIIIMITISIHIAIPSSLNNKQYSSIVVLKFIEVLHSMIFRVTFF